MSDEPLRIERSFLVQLLIQPDDAAESFERTLERLTRAVEFSTMREALGEALDATVTARVLEGPPTKEYLVTYGTIVDSPKNRGESGTSDLKTLVIEANNVVEAFCVAYDYLTRAGRRVRWPHGRPDEQKYPTRELYTRHYALSEQDWEAALARGVPKEVGTGFAMAGDSSIKSIEPYTVAVTGRVIAQK